MINLIPPSARKQVAREYWLRVVTVWCFIFGTTLLLIGAAQAPVYVLIEAQRDAFAASANEAATLRDDFLAAQAALTHTNALATLIARNHATAQFTGYIDAFDALRGEGITIRELRLTRTGDAVGAIALTGLATTRQALASYRDRIEADPRFVQVELPISNLAKDQDILFTITVTPAAPDDSV